MVSYVADCIKAGQVVGMPTDTFYGLAADPLNLRAVDLIYEVKTRSRHKPLSLLIESVEQAEYLAAWPLPDAFYTITKKYWPGPVDPGPPWPTMPCRRQGLPTAPLSTSVRASWLAGHQAIW